MIMFSNNILDLSLPVQVQIKCYQYQLGIKVPTTYHKFITYQLPQKGSDNEAWKYD